MPKTTPNVKLHFLKLVLDILTSFKNATKQTCHLFLNRCTLLDTGLTECTDRAGWRLYILESRKGGYTLYLKAQKGNSIISGRWSGSGPCTWSIEVGALMFSSKVVSFFLFLAFHAWYTFSLRWNSSLDRYTSIMKDTHIPRCTGCAVTPRSVLSQVSCRSTDDQIRAGFAFIGGGVHFVKTRYVKVFRRKLQWQ
jgi:hypothetical protein